MNVSPLDLRQQRFRTRFRGYDTVEVVSLLTAVADDYEQALKETDRLRQELMQSVALLQEHRDREQNLKNTLMTAQKIADDIKATAQQEAQRIVRDAESRSELLLEKMRARLEDVQRDIDDLKLKRREVEVSIEGVILALRSTVDHVRETDVRDRDEKILLHRPRPRDADTADERETPEVRRVVG
jgi:cell division initiation protein